MTTLRPTRLNHRIDALSSVSNRYSWLRVLVFVGGVVGVSVAYFAVGAWLFWLVLALWIVLFVGVVALHRRVERAITRATLLRTFHATQAARAAVAWDDLPPARFVTPRFDHPFEGDLDLVGPHSVHRLLDLAVSPGGSERLRAWLTAPHPDADAIAQRQTLVRELTPRRLFRTRLWLDARAAAPDADWDPARLLRWLEEHEDPTALRPRLLLLALLAAVNIAAVAANLLGPLGPIWQVTVPVYLIVYFALSRPARAVFHEASALQSAVEQLAAVTGYLERFGYAGAPALRHLCAPLLDATTRPSAFLRRIRTVTAATGIQGNPVIWFLLNAVVPWDYFFAYQLSRYKTTAKTVAPRWLDIWAELEALSALANLADLNPGYVLPTVQEAVHATGAGTGEPVFAATALGHPLIPAAQKVSNDFQLASLGDIALLTGSNMAGKSTFLRTLGVNLALAFAGGPVDATSFVTRRWRLFTCIRVSDSIADGISYFYAEVKRLRALLDALEQADDGVRPDDPLPLFFLIDEIFRGTNNRERLAGSRAYIRALTGKRGVGVISTHDLELTHLADEIPTVRNYHFRDDITDERMVFDYRLRPGPCPTTNALKIMALEGLPTGDNN